MATEIKDLPAGVRVHRDSKGNITGFAGDNINPQILYDLANKYMPVSSGPPKPLEMRDSSGNVFQTKDASGNLLDFSQGVPKVNESFIPKPNNTNNIPKPPNVPQPMNATANTTSAPTNFQGFVPPPKQDAIQTPKPTIPAMNMEQIQDYVNKQIQAQLDRSRSEADQTIERGRLTAQQQLEGLQTSFDRNRQNIQEDRTLENAQLGRQLNPFSGRSDYARGMVEMQRGRTDREMLQDLESRQANVQANLAQLENEINAKYAALQETSGAERERLMREIQNDERNYELMLRGENRADVLANADLYNQHYNQALNAFNVNRGIYESDRAFDRGVYESDRNYGLDYAGQFGQLPTGQSNSQLNNVLNQVLALKQASTQSGHSSQDLANMRQQADVLRNQLSQMGIDPNLFEGANVSYAQAAQNAQRLLGQNSGSPLTLQAQNLLHNQDMARREADRLDATTQANLTGNYMPPAAQPLLDELLSLKQQAEQPGNTPQAMESFRQRANEIRKDLALMNVDISKLGADTNYEKTLSNISTGFPTMDRRGFDQQVSQQDWENRFATQQFNASEAQRQWDNAFKNKQFNQNEAQRIWENNFKDKTFEQGVREFVQRNNLDWARMNQSDRQHAAEMAFKEKALSQEAQQFSSKLAQDQSQFQAQMNAQSNQPQSYKENSEFASDYSYVVNNPGEARKLLTENADQFIMTYGFDGYQALVKGLPKSDQDAIMQLLQDALN